MKWALAIAGILVFVARAFGDAPLSSPSQVQRWSPNRRYVAVADPKKNVITVYHAEGSTRKELWSREGWERAFDVADDGEHLVACYSGLNLLPSELRDQLDHVVVLQMRGCIPNMVSWRTHSGLVQAAKDSVALSLGALRWIRLDRTL
jgi:hypothetical protein